MKLKDFLDDLRLERGALERLTAELRDIVGLGVAVPSGDSPPATAIASTPDLTHLECYRFSHDKLCSENELTNNRLSWSFTIHGFLFAAFALTLQTIGNLDVRLADTQLDLAAKSQLKQVISMLNTMIQLMSWTGIFVSLFIAIGAIAAQLAILSIQKKFHEQHPEHKTAKWKTHGVHFPGVTGGGSVLAHVFGTFPLLIPIVFIVIWSLVLWHLPIR